MRSYGLARVLLGVLLAGALSPAMAATATAPQNLQVTAQVDASCIIASVTNMSFGTYIATQTNNARDATSTVGVRCVSNSANVRVAFDEGQNPASDSTCATPKRRLKGANGDYLNYQIYSDSGRSVVRGCATGTNDHAIPASSFTNSDTVVTVTQYGRLFGGQESRITTYSDTIGVTVTF